MPLPWQKGNASNGFNDSGLAWLPQPASYAELSLDQQELDPESTLNLYRQMLKLRREHRLGEGSFDWLSQGDVLAYKNGAVTVIHNFSAETIALPAGKLLLSSLPLNAQGQLNPNDSAWVLD